MKAVLTLPAFLLTSLLLASTSPLARCADESFDVDHVFAATEIESPPETVKITNTKYPESLVGSGKSGMVAVAIVIDQMGDIEDVEVVKASDPEFSKPAVECVRHWRFIAGYHKGRNVKARLIVPLRFQPDSAAVATK